MASAQVLMLLLAAAGFLDSASGQAYNGYINPLFLPRGLRRGRVYDPYVGDLRDNGYLLSRGPVYPDDYRRSQVGLDYNRYDDYRRYQSPYEDYRRYQFGPDRRYNDPYRSYPEDIRLRYQSDVGLVSAASPLDNNGLGLERGSGLYERGLGLYRGAGLELDRGLGLGSDRGLGLGSDRSLDSLQVLDRKQILSTSAPELSVSLRPNSATE